MFTCRIILHGDLAELHGGRHTVTRRIAAATTAGDAVAAIGIPHGEVGATRLDGAAADLDSLLRGDALLEVWPAEPLALEDARFLCDTHLGKLARLLRFCGFDTLWDRTLTEPAHGGLARRLLAVRAMRPSVLGRDARRPDLGAGPRGAQAGLTRCCVPQRGHFRRDATRPGGTLSTAPQEHSTRRQPSLV